MVKPFSEASIQLKNSNLQDMSFINVNDYGGRVEHQIKLQ
ncbi:molecular chaperone, partial [Klebsiella pneumoniae]